MKTRALEFYRHPLMFWGWVVVNRRKAGSYQKKNVVLWKLLSNQGHLEFSMFPTWIASSSKMGGHPRTQISPEACEWWHGQIEVIFQEYMHLEVYFNSFVGYFQCIWYHISSRSSFVNVLWEGKRQGFYYFCKIFLLDIYMTFSIYLSQFMKYLCCKSSH